MPLANWRTQVYNVIGSVLFNNPHRSVHFMLTQPDGSLVDRTTRSAPVRRLAETSAEGGRQCLQTIQFVHHALIPPGGRHVHELHVHPDAEELVIITQGCGRFRIGAETHLVRQGDVAYIPPNAEHSLENDSDDLLGAIFVNVPVGDGLTRLREMQTAEAAAKTPGL